MRNRRERSERVKLWVNWIGSACTAPPRRANLRLQQIQRECGVQMVQAPQRGARQLELPARQVVGGQLPQAAVLAAQPGNSRRRHRAGAGFVLLLLLLSMFILLFLFFASQSLPRKNATTSPSAAARATVDISWLWFVTAG
jgi:hypothetical protein